MFSKRYGFKIFPVITIQIILYLNIVCIECNVIGNNVQSKRNESSYQFLKIIPTPKLLKTTWIVSDKENATLINNNVPTTIDDDHDDKALEKVNKLDDYADFDYIYEPKGPQATTCILNKPEYYMSWWVNEDGSLKLARPMRGQCT